MSRFTALLSVMSKAMVMLGRFRKHESLHLRRSSLHPVEFSSDVLEELKKKQSNEVVDVDKQRRRDLTHLACYGIDKCRRSRRCNIY